MKRKNEYKYTCIACSLYGLLQYLLLQSEEDARENTFYFFSQGIPKDIQEKLPSVCPFTFNPNDKKDRVKQFFQKMRLRLTMRIRWPFVCHTKIFAQDQTSLSMLIGRNKYSLLADAPGFLALNAQKDSLTYQTLIKRRRSLSGKLESILFTPINLYAYGDNKQCEEFFLPSEDISHVLNGKIVHINPLEDLWVKSSESKKKFLLGLFGVTSEDLAFLKSRTTFFFSQPIVERNTLTKGEYIALLRQIFQSYDISDLLIKAHPQDDFRYEDYFPGIQVYRKKVSIQFLQIIGVQIKKAVTICSTSVLSLPKETEVVWLGTSIHPKIERFFGSNYKQPPIKTN